MQCEFRYCNIVIGLSSSSQVKGFGKSRGMDRVRTFFGWRSLSDAKEAEQEEPDEGQWVIVESSSGLLKYHFVLKLIVTNPVNTVTHFVVKGIFESSILTEVLRMALQMVLASQEAQLSDFRLCGKIESCVRL